MPRTITDEEYRYLQGRATTANFVESIYNDPRLNKEAKALIKKKYPNLPIPDYDLEMKVENTFNAERKKRDDAEKAERERKQEADWQKKRAAVKKEYNFTDEAMTKMEKMMVEREIPDYDAAAALMAAKEPKPIEAHFDAHLWNHPKKEGFKEIAADPEGWGRKELMGAISRDIERAKNTQY